MKIIGGILSIAALFALLWQADKYVAHAEDLRLVEVRLEQKIQADRAKAVQQRNWELEKEYKGKPMPPAVESEIRENKQEIEEIKTQIKSGGK